MQISQYLIIKKSGSRYNQRYSTRVTKSAPALDANEIAIKVNLTLPEAIFEKPAFEAKVVIPEDAVTKPVVSAEVIDNVEEIIKKNTGFEVKLEIVTTKVPEEDTNNSN